MTAERSLRNELRNLLQYGPLSFRDFVELALYHPEFGYYTRGESPAGKGGDFITAPSLSPVFSFAIAGLFREFVRRADGEVCSFVDIGCGDGGLVRAVEAQIAEKNVRFFGVDRTEGSAGVSPAGSAASAPPSQEPGAGTAPSQPAGRRRSVLVRSIDELPRDGAHFIFSSELYDAIPFARLVQRGEHLHELYVSERDGELDWSEHEAPAAYDDYFSSRGIELLDGQFADVALEWDAFHEDVARFVTRGLIVTLDYGYRDQKLFHPRARRFGTAAAYSRQRVHRDLLADPGEQDLTAHINFADLERAGERQGARVLFFDVLAKFLLAIGITEHELFKPVHEAIQEVTGASADEGLALLEARDEARRLILPDGMGEDLRVLVQAKGMSFENWSFQRPLF